jgi:hypothetical protein
MGEIQRRERKIERERAAIELLVEEIAAYDKNIKAYNSRMRPNLVRPIPSSQGYVGVDGKPERLKDAITRLLKANMPEGLTTSELFSKYVEMDQRRRAFTGQASPSTEVSCESESHYGLIQDQTLGTPLRATAFGSCKRLTQPFLTSHFRALPTVLWRKVAYSSAS